MRWTLSFATLSIVFLAGCPGKRAAGSSGVDAGVESIATASHASSSASSPPCTVTLTGHRSHFAGADFMEYVVTNTSPHPIVDVRIDVYAYDDAGKLLGRLRMNDHYGNGESVLKRGEARTPKSGADAHDVSGKSLVGVPGVTFELVVDRVQFDGAAEWDDDAAEEEFESSRARPKRGGK